MDALEHEPATSFDTTKMNEENSDTNSLLNSDKDSDNIAYVINEHLVESVKDMNFINGELYELTFQKGILDLNEKIVEVCLLYISIIIKYDKIFPLQFICYLILRRIYFTFPQYSPEIGDYIITTLSNLCKFEGQFEWNRSLECRQFAFYLLANDRILKTKIKCATAVAPFDIRYENLILRKANMTIGFNNIVTIDARKSIERKIENFDENGIIYISFGMQKDDNKTIDVELFKYDSDNSKWTRIFEGKNIDFEEGHRKIVIFSKQASIYKIKFDNSRSWLTKKKILYRFVFLKPLAK